MTTTLFVSISPITEALNSSNTTNNTIATTKKTNYGKAAAVVLPILFGLVVLVFGGIGGN
jgi:hypothetical protein